jgi:hypothetical protein
MDMIYNGSIYYCTHSKMTEYDPKEMIRNFKEKMGLPGLT